MSDAVQPADFAFFSTLAACSSLSAAARELGLSTAGVSRRLAQMEARLGLPLVNRTSRRMSLTPEGEVYLEKARSILGQIGDLEDLLRGTTQTPRGLLRVNATLGFGRSHVAPLLPRFVDAYPQVDVQLQLSVTPPAYSEDAYDVCVRFGQVPDSRLVARFLAHNRRIVCASPDYLLRHGAPATPEDLAKHNCIGIRQGDEYGVWRFTPARGRAKSAGEETHVRIRGNLTTNDGGVAVNWAVAGKGILLRAEWDLAEHLARGELVHILEGYETTDADIYAVYPRQHRSLVRVRVFVDYLRDAFAQDVRFKARRGQVE